MSTLASFCALQLTFELRATEPIYLHAFNGSALRGMLYRAAMRLANEPQHRDAPAFSNEPMLQRLLHTLDEHNLRGQDIPRPYVIDPPPPLPEDQRLLPPNGLLTFGLTLFGELIEAFPMIVLSLRRAESMGLGRFIAREAGEAQPAQRGRFALHRVLAHHPYRRMTQHLFAEGDRIVHTPELFITEADVRQQAERDTRAVHQRLTLRFHTPTSLKAQGEWVRQPQFNVIVHRLLDRLEQLSRAYAQPLACLPRDRDAKLALLRCADAVRLVEDETHWVPLRGYSERTRATTNLGGFIGRAVFEADSFVPFLELLRWAEIVHLGQHAVKGNGLVRIELV
ncbi:MAG: CRISPR system precrRNA processing endoribonuclease RAMP protein Cas6 [Thermoflexales bacterium]|nr:CRISPR system precrRNA processing endoribonuclease RAMP protein Cas6 [Thermoflexales bacterium]